MTRRELTDAVVAAAREVEKVGNEPCRSTEREYVGPGYMDAVRRMVMMVRALDACTEPDLSAHNERVAEAVDRYAQSDEHGFSNRCANGLWNAMRVALDARRAALKPKERWTVRNNPNGTTVALFDGKCDSSWTLPFDVTFETMHKVADLLNERERK